MNTNTSTQDAGMAPETIARQLTETAGRYAAKLQDAGFTVYLTNKPAYRADGTPRPEGWFHYSRTVDGVERFGTFNDGSQNFDGPRHSMPLVPSRLNGSSASIRPRPRTLSPLSVEYAVQVTQPDNFCPYNAEPTEQATRRADVGGVVPQSWYRGATLANGKPWGIGKQYLPAAPHGAAPGDPAPTEAEAALSEHMRELAEGFRTAPTPPPSQTKMLENVTERVWRALLRASLIESGDRLSIVQGGSTYGVQVWLVPAGHTFNTLPPFVSAGAVVGRTKREAIAALEMVALTLEAVNAR